MLVEFAPVEEKVGNCVEIAVAVAAAGAATAVDAPTVVLLDAAAGRMVVVGIVVAAVASEQAFSGVCVPGTLDIPGPL